MFVTKSDKVRAYVSKGNYKKALAIAKDFKIGITRERSDAMSLAYECLVHERFYRQLKVDTDAAIKNGISVLREIYA